jgi:hypothetical protein
MAGILTYLFVITEQDSQWRDRSGFHTDFSKN